MLPVYYFIKMFPFFPPLITKTTNGTALLFTGQSFDSVNEPCLISQGLISYFLWGVGRDYCQAESVIAISGILIFKIKSMMLISLIHLMLRQILFSFLFFLSFLQKIHRALNMTYEDVKRQRANTEKRFWLCFINLFSILITAGLCLSQLVS